MKKQCIRSNWSSSSFRVAWHLGIIINHKHFALTSMMLFWHIPQSLLPATLISLCILWKENWRMLESCWFQVQDMLVFKMMSEFCWSFFFFLLFQNLLQEKQVKKVECVSVTLLFLMCWDDWCFYRTEVFKCWNIETISFMGKSTVFLSCSGFFFFSVFYSVINVLHLVIFLHSVFTELDAHSDICNTSA